MWLTWLFKLGGHYQGDIILQPGDDSVSMKSDSQSLSNRRYLLFTAERCCHSISLWNSMAWRCCPVWIRSQHKSVSLSKRKREDDGFCLASNNSQLIVRMMREMENLTSVNGAQCIKFREKNASDTVFITILNGSGCSAPIGSWGNYTGVRPVSLFHSSRGTCMVSGIIQHELNHVLGRKSQWTWSVELSFCLNRFFSWTSSTRSWCVRFDTME